MNTVVTAEHRATSEIDLGDLNLARMHSLDRETNDLKLCKTSCFDSSFVPFGTHLSMGWPVNPGTLELKACPSGCSVGGHLRLKPSQPQQLRGHHRARNDFMEHANKMLITFYGAPSIAKGLLMSACTC